METGQLVKVRAYGGHELPRIIIKVEKDVVVVCSPEEYRLAKMQGREPLGVGFHLEDVLPEVEGAQV